MIRTLFEQQSADLGVCVWINGGNTVSVSTVPLYRTELKVIYCNWLRKRNEMEIIKNFILK